MTTGFIVAIIALPIAWLICLTGIVYAAVAVKRGTANELTALPAIFGTLGLVAVTIGGLTGLYPYNMAYHSWRVHQGTVAHISSRLLGNGGGSDQKYVVQFDGSSQPYGINDTRASLVHVGDRLKITCVKTHQWGGGVDGFDCRWDQ